MKTPEQLVARLLEDDEYDPKEDMLRWSPMADVLSRLGFSEPADPLESFRTKRYLLACPIYFKLPTPEAIDKPEGWNASALARERSELTLRVYDFTEEAGRIDSEADVVDSDGQPSDLLYQFIPGEATPDDGSNYRFVTGMDGLFKAAIQHHFLALSDLYQYLTDNLARFGLPVNLFQRTNVEFLALKGETRWRSLETMGYRRSQTL